MKKGDIVTIYQDPLTKQEIEGQAQLCELAFIDEGSRFEYWKVKFLGGGDGDPIVHRFIMKKENSHDNVK